MCQDKDILEANKDNHTHFIGRDAQDPMCFITPLTNYRNIEDIKKAASLEQKNVELTATFNAAIEYAISADDGLDWLRLWRSGDIEGCKEWKDAPEHVYNCILSLGSN